jgi:hypothetical protein
MKKPSFSARFKENCKVGDKWPASHQFQDQFHGLPHSATKRFEVNILMPSKLQLLEERRALCNRSTGDPRRREKSALAEVTMNCF